MTSCHFFTRYRCSKILPVAVGRLLSVMTSVVVDSVVVVVGITASTVVVEEESVPVIHSGRDCTSNVCTPGKEH